MADVFFHVSYYRTLTSNLLDGAGLDSAHFIPVAITSSQLADADNLFPYRRKPCGTPLKR